MLLTTRTKIVHPGGTITKVQQRRAVTVANHNHEIPKHIRITENVFVVVLLKL
jgi:hypothetical protein